MMWMGGFEEGWDEHMPTGFKGENVNDVSAWRNASNV